MRNNLDLKECNFSLLRLILEVSRYLREQNRADPCFPATTKKRAKYTALISVIMQDGSRSHYRSTICAYSCEDTTLIYYNQSILSKEIDNLHGLK